MKYVTAKNAVIRKSERGDYNLILSENTRIDAFALPSNPRDYATACYETFSCMLHFIPFQRTPK